MNSFFNHDYLHILKRLKLIFFKERVVIWSGKYLRRIRNKKLLILEIIT